MQIKVAGAAAALLLLAGCASSIQQVRDAHGTGSPFTQALTEDYKSYTDLEVGYYEWSNAYLFAHKGLAAARGENVLPEQLDGWDIPDDKKPELLAARGRLIAALDGGARDSQPEAAAKAQVNYDCWVEEQDINLGRWVDGHDDLHQDRLDVCKKGVYDFLEMIEKKPVAAQPAPAQTPSNYTVYFDFDKSFINPAGQQVINQVLEDAKAHNPSSISVVGHTDLTGPEDYNMALSLRRADSVRTALISGGVPADKITVAGRGMSEPAVPTPRGVREARNRRAEITLQP